MLKYLEFIQTIPFRFFISLNGEYIDFKSVQEVKSDFDSMTPKKRVKRIN